MKSTCRMHSHRRGISLVELMVTMMAGATLLLLSINVVQRTMKMSSRNHHTDDHLRSLARLREQWQSDVHSARSARVLKSEATNLDGVQLIGADGSTTTYSITPQRLVREHQDAGAQSATRFATFLLSDEYRTVFSVAEPLVSLRVFRRSQDKEVLEMHVEAQIDRLGQLQRRSQ